MADRSGEMHKAVIAALKAAAPVSAIVAARVYDRIPQSAAFPYIQITMDAGEPWDGVNLDGWECVFRVDHWSRKRGASIQSYQMAAGAYEALHDQALTLDAGALVLGRLLPSGARLIRDQDGETVHVEQRYRFVIQG